VPSLRFITPLATAFLTLGLLAAVPEAPATAADPLLGAPKAGQCYDVSGRTAYEAESTSATPVRCATKHTLWVVGVGTVPADVPLKIGNRKFEQQASRICDPATRRALGDRGLRFARSAYNTFRFVPTDEQQAAGARWISCEVGITNGRGKLVSTRAPKPTKVTGSVPDRIKLCGTRDYGYITCAAKHVYRSTYAGYVRGRYTEARYQETARAVCPRHVRTRQYMFGARIIEAKRWILVCLTKTSR